MIHADGQIANVCRWLFTKSLTGPAAEDDRELLRALCRFQGPTKSAALGKVLKWGRAKLHRRLDHLCKCGLLIRIGAGSESALHAFADPTFAVWLSQDTGLVGPVITDTLEAQRRYANERMYQATKWFEASVLGVMHQFNGSRRPGSLFGVRGYVTLPKFDRVDNLELYDSAGFVHGKPENVEIDSYGSGPECWLGEAKGGKSKSSQKELEKLTRKAAFMQQQGLRVDRLWFVAEGGHTEAAEKFAMSNGIYLTTGAQLMQLRVDLALRQQRRASKATP